MVKTEGLTKNYTRQGKTFQAVDHVDLQVEKGEVLLDAVTKPCQVEKLGKASFRMILTQGLNRQIRRMCEALGYQVTNLKRVRVLNIELKGMKPGTWRKVTEKEMSGLLELIRDSRE